MFDYYISLGSACPIASSMSKYGLRSFSGVFDWLITPDFSWVLHYMETDFKDFLLQENLERFDDYPLHFRDKKSNIKFIHDTESFENEYEKLKEKYEQRINKFLDKSKSKICYLRSMRNKSNYKYIEDNADYIKYIVKKNNPESEIVFLCNEDLSVNKDFQFQYYRMPGIWNGLSRWNLRSHFDHATDFLSFCGENYSGVKLIKNLSFDIENNEPLLQLTERKYKTLTTLLSYDFSKNTISDKVIIYGAGVIGKELYKKLKGLTSIICFVDKQKAGSSFENIKIVSLNEVYPENGIKIIVSAAYDFENIKKGLLNKFANDDIISLDEILNLNF